MSILKISRLIAISLVFWTINISSARATDISALDFNGNLLGKVIPDGSVVNFNNDIIGYITADGLVFNNDKNLIGGIVPQGVAISANNKILGKVNNDGSVTSVNDSLIGKVLPNGLVVNNNYDVIGNVISPGLVYNDGGNIVGRVSGDGRFYDLSGNNEGFVTSDGYAYTTTNTDGKAVLVGKLISSKIIISPQGKFLGGIAPDGKVIDLQKNALGRIHANGFVYNDDGKSIGHTVETGYAFDFDGTYLGVVSYNGEVINQGANVAQAIFGNRVINKNGNVIGFTISTSATFNTIKGKYLGRIIADGIVVKGRNVVGKIGTSGNVINSKGEVIGFLNYTGPIFDYLGNIKANAAINGAVISMEGSEIGYMQKSIAYDLKEKELGTILSNKLVFDNHNNFLGMSGINSQIAYNGKNYKISPYGYVFDENNSIAGRNYNFSSIYAPDGNVLTNITGEALAENAKLKDKAKLVSAGYFIDKDNKILGKTISEKYVTDFKGNSLGYINPTNLIANQENNLYAKILPNGEVVSNNAKVTEKYGRAGNTSLSISINGDYLGTNTWQGAVRKAGEIIGQVSSNQYVIDNQGSLYGKTIPFGVAVDENCNFIGVVTENGKIKTAKGTYIGIALANNQVMNDEQEVIGYVIDPMPVNGKNGEILGIQSALGTVYNYKNQNLGCQNIYGRIQNTQKNLVGQVLTYTSAMGFDNKLLGYTDENGKIIDIMGKENGVVSEEGSVQDKSGKDIGTLFKYTVAFDKNNIYLGRVNLEGQVISDEGNVIGTVNYNGKVKYGEDTEGFALYDLYVYDNNGKTVGYISKNGRVYSIMGDLIGVIYNGFVIDKKQNLIARGARDYDIRDKDKKIIGFLQLDGKVINAKNIEIGTLAENGNIINADEQSIAIADPLQYYHKLAKAKRGSESIEINKTEDEEDEIEKIINASSQQPNEQNINGEGMQPQIPTLQQQGGNTSGAQFEPINKESAQQTKQRVNEESTISHSSGISDQESQSVDDQEDEDDADLEIEEDAEDENENSEQSEEKNIKPSPSNTSRNENWFRKMTEGATVSPYDDKNTIKNVGPGGGIGPGGRYNPRRAALLNQMYNNRRQGLAGKKIGNDKDLTAYTGWQDNWDRKVKNTDISSLRVNMDNMITADKAIPAVVASPMISLGKAPATAIVERNIYGMNGRNVVIPAGSRIIGKLQKADGGREDAESGGVKVDIEWVRIIRPDGIMFTIDGSTGDAQGRGGGAVGYVDEQMLKKYGVPLLGTVATSGIAYLLASNEEATGQIETSKQQAANDARENFINQMNDIQKEIMKEKQKIKAVTYVPAGTRIVIYPNNDLWLKTTKDIDKKRKSSADQEVTSFVSEDSAEGTNNNTNQNNQNNQNNNEGGLVDEGPRNNNNTNAGALPPAASDGAGMPMPEEKKEDDGEIDLF